MSRRDENRHGYNKKREKKEKEKEKDEKEKDEKRKNKEKRKDEKREKKKEKEKRKDEKRKNKEKRKDEKRKNKEKEKEKRKDDKMRRELLFKEALNRLGKRYHDFTTMKKGLEAMLSYYKTESKTNSNSNSSAFFLPYEYQLKFTALRCWYEFCFGKDEEALLLDGINDLDDFYTLLFLQLL